MSAPSLRRRIAIQTQDFVLQNELDALCEGDAAAGAVTSFVGLVRAWGEGSEALELEHYPGMTERSIDQMIDEAARRFDIRGVCVIHRVGRLTPGAQIVLVAVTSSHRRAAFEACEFLMDWLKTQAPFWKKEVTDGVGRWVDAREQDDAALARWGNLPGTVVNAHAPRD
ncbi:MAG TPA: molybdenum cofactor biosynthesis protein MoaE [Aquabacterium sp.]|nr:molybdenum cofactor biosynthesis protein MoaE [Aquabacterium sp.]HRH29317.1 molybdenum cofactor biosynthesis protein MoaE [Aquabacterium sp.]